jgi:hypothetical protein
MPFTVSHVAAVVPLYRRLSRAHVFSAAVIGSMVPDFGMLLPGSLARWQTHSLVGLFSFCLPVGLIVYILTQWLVKPAIAEVLPDGAYLRLRAQHPSTDLRRASIWLYAAIALLFGALTHLIWDAFTHENGRGVRFFPFLSDYGPQMAGHSLQLYRWIQYGSSVFGLAVIAWGLRPWLRQAHALVPEARPQRILTRHERWFWCALYSVVPLAALVLGVAVTISAGDGITNGTIVSSIAILTMRSLALSLLLVSGLIRLRLAR